MQCGIIGAFHHKLLPLGLALFLPITFTKTFTPARVIKVINRSLNYHRILVRLIIALLRFEIYTFY